MSRRQKQFSLLMIDVILAPLAFYLTCAIVFGSIVPKALFDSLFLIICLLPPVAAMACLALGVHRIQLKAYESTAILRTGAVAAIITASVAVSRTLLDLWFPVAGIFLFGLIFFLLAVGSRFALLNLLLWVLRLGTERTRVLIYGAGTTGMQLAAALRSHERVSAVAFVDDNAALHGTTVAGLRVYPVHRIDSLVQDRQIDRVLLAMPSVSTPKLGKIARGLQARGLDVMTVPSFAQLVGSETLIDSLTKVAPDKFLGRLQVDKALPLGAEAYTGKSILVSGAGGSVGSELCRQLILHRPNRIVLFEVSEIGLYNIDRELQELASGTGVEIVPVLGTVTDGRMARAAIVDNAVQVILHAAAYKHVPIVEANPIAGVSNNVLGTRVLADAAEECGAERFILISTDKAVRPTNVMGASKRLAEHVVQDLARRSKSCLFSIVRFGNVLGSSGSVIPLFKEQIARGGPVTLTHEDVTRYFMTISEAVRLVLLAGSFADADGTRGGDVFVLDMGKPTRIRDLAVQMIEAAGYTVRSPENPDGDIDIEVIGLRPGEKLHEELLIGEGFLTTPHPKIMRAREAGLPEIRVAGALRALRTAVATGDSDGVRRVITDCVEGYQPAVVPEALRSNA
jgi:FlaA1/EpsC-like NDP-sugar epimerase